MFKKFAKILKKFKENSEENKLESLKVWFDFKKLLGKFEKSMK